MLGLLSVGIDPLVLDWTTRWRPGGDFRRELEFLQQFGAISSIVIACLLVLLLDPAPREILRRRIADWAMAAVIVGLSGNLLKMILGRPRPLFADPHHLLGPLGKYPVEVSADGTVGLVHAWQLGTRGLSDLWSMPSSHAMAAACMGFVLCAYYPRLRPLCLFLVVVVCVARVVLRAHYVSDVLIGAGLGWLIAAWCLRHQVGSNLLTRLGLFRAAPA